MKPPFLILSLGVTFVLGIFGADNVRATAPANDNFASAATITGTMTTINATNAAATLETGEPHAAPNSFGTGTSNTLWYTWTAPQAGFVTIDTIGTAFDNVLAVYQVTPINGISGLNGLNQVGYNRGDAAGSLGQHKSLIYFPARTNQVFKIQVGSYYSDGGTAGAIVLNLHMTTPASGGLINSSVFGAPVPFNNAFISAYALTGSKFTALGFNESATTETSEPNIAPDSFASGLVCTLWYKWTAPSTGIVTMDTIGSIFSNGFAVYTGTVISALTPVSNAVPAAYVANNLQSGESQMKFPVTSGQVYFIQVGSYLDNGDGSAGTVFLNVNLVGTKAQTITFPAIAAKTLGGAAFTLTATASSGLPVTYSVITNPVTVSASTVTLGQTVTIQATQAGNATYAAATPVSQKFTVK